MIVSYKKLVDTPPSSLHHSTKRNRPPT